MAYEIAVATSDGKTVDLSYGGVEQFVYYRVEEDGAFARMADGDWKDTVRCLICRKIGPPARKKLEWKEISIFEVPGYDVEEAVGKIAEYFYKLDHHISLAGHLKNP